MSFTMNRNLVPKLGQIEGCLEGTCNHIQGDFSMSNEYAKPQPMVMYCYISVTNYVHHVDELRSDTIHILSACTQSFSNTWPMGQSTSYSE